jgi:hypothetical protein
VLGRKTGLEIGNFSEKALSSVQTIFGRARKGNNIPNIAHAAHPHEKAL